MNANLKDARVFIVDDQQINIDILENLLTLEGYVNVKSTTDSRQALQIIKEFKPNLLLLDLMMPNINGYELGNRIYANNSFNGRY